jgi:uncharacterized protein
MDEARLKARSVVEVEPFVARAPWWGGDLQTLSNYLRPPVRLSAWGEERLVLPLGDGSGDRLAASLSRPAKGAAVRPLVVLIHGLSGDENSKYIRRTAVHLLALGYPVLRLNLRGAGASRPLSKTQYHAGRTGDLELALAALPASLKANGVAAVGFSLGGNMLLKFLGERGHAAPIAAGASVSAPIDLALTSRRLMERRNAVYQSYVLRDMKKEALAPASEVSAEERRMLKELRSIWEFDARFSVPRNGFAGIDDYYEQNSARHYLGGIKVPTLVVHALDDPWVPAAPYVAHAWHANANLVPLLPERGGHVGFQGRDRSAAWHDRAIGRFLEDVFRRS